MIARTSRIVASTPARLQQISAHLAPALATSPPRHYPSQQNLSTMATVAPKGKLNTGAEIPLIGFGTWQDADAQTDAVAEAIKAGYRHIDTAWIYGTEKNVKAGIDKAGVPRNELFITTKLWNNAHRAEDVEKQLDLSLKNLGTDYVDLYLMHWPGAFKPSEEAFPKDSNDKTVPADIDYLDTWKGMEKVFKSGKAKGIGVSNFAQKEVQRLWDNSEVKPAAHQMEMHPYLQQQSFASFHKGKGIHVTHYSPFGNQNEIYSSGQKYGKLIDDPTLAEIGKKHGKTGAHVALAWGIAQGHSVIPKSKTPSRIRDNLQGGDIKLSQEELDKISTIDKKLRFNDPSGSFGYTFFSDLEGKQ